MDRSLIIYPSADLFATEILRGPHIKPFPKLAALPEDLRVKVIVKVEDNISTDTIMPAGNTVLPLRSNIEAISKYIFYQIAPDFSVYGSRWPRVTPASIRRICATSEYCR